jgi:hypothetical protein
MTLEATLPSNCLDTYLNGLSDLTAVHYLNKTRGIPTKSDRAEICNKLKEAFSSAEKNKDRKEWITIAGMLDEQSQAIEKANGKITFFCKLLRALESWVLSELAEGTADDVKKADGLDYTKINYLQTFLKDDEAKQRLSEKLLEHLTPISSATLILAQEDKADNDQPIKAAVTATPTLENKENNDNTIPATATATATDNGEATEIPKKEDSKKSSKHDKHGKHHKKKHHHKHHHKSSSGDKASKSEDIPDKTSIITHSLFNNSNKEETSTGIDAQVNQQQAIKIS